MPNPILNHSISPAGVRKRKRVLDESPLPSLTIVDLQQLRLGIQYRSPSDLKPPRRALRKYSKRAQARMKRALTEFGFLIAVVVDGTGRIVSGHRRWIAAKDLGLQQVPVVEVTHLTDEQLRMFTLLDNRLSEDGEWDFDELRVEFAELESLCGQFDLTIEDTGFNTAELDNLTVGAPTSPQEETEDLVPDVQIIPITRPGDRWRLGHHQLICGSALDEQTFEQLLGTERAQMVFADPPYNLPSKAYSGKGKHRHGNFAMAAGEQSRAEFTTFLGTAFGHLAKFSVDGAIHFLCMDFRHMREMLAAGDAAYTEFKNLIVWKKHSAGMGTFYRSQHELLFLWKNGTAAHINNFGLGETGRHRSNVWEYRGNAGFHAERDDELASHATVKPWSLVADAIRDCSKRGGIIVDPFGGSGTTLIAAERTGRKARLIELDPLYCDVTIRRWEKLTSNQAVLVETGQTFAEVEAARVPLAEFEESNLGDDFGDDLGEEEAA